MARSIYTVARFLQRKPEDGKLAASCLLVSLFPVYEIFERLAYYGVAANLVQYLTTVLHEDMVSSVRNVTNWWGVVWLTPLLGAYIADTYLGRFWTFTIASIINLLGMAMLSAGVIFKDTLFPSSCKGSACDRPKAEITFFYLSLYILALGAGGTKPNISTLGADQFDDYNQYENKLKSSFFNWWFFGSFIGALLSTIMVYLQDNKGWGIGYGIPTIGLFVSLIVFYAGVPLYRHKPTKSQSPISEIFGVYKKAFVNRRIKISDESSEVTLHELEPKEYIMTAKRQLLHTSCFK
ncbi:hypothetical protein LUZ60_003897 [Juncus effusus]|nr:hypothetical protein LUZ60_003897 [Juncus effusus]